MTAKSSVFSAPVHARQDAPPRTLKRLRTKGKPGSSGTTLSLIPSRPPLNGKKPAAVFKSDSSSSSQFAHFEEPCWSL